MPAIKIFLLNFGAQHTLWTHHRNFPPHHVYNTHGTELDTRAVSHVMCVDSCKGTRTPFTTNNIIFCCCFLLGALCSSSRRVEYIYINIYPST